ncbi:MAG: response regulator [Ignavibacteriales bacterium]|nr:response regulator [Ignavibacteriales bacterium]
MDKILVVDDEPGIVQVTSLFLQSEGYEAEGASDGVEAQAVIEVRPDEFSAIILDWTMPRMSGIDLLKWMKQNDRYENIPVIMQTAKMSPEDIKEGIDAGAFYYLTKPIQKDIMLSILKAAVSDLQYKKSLIQKIKEGDNPFGFLYDAEFRVRTLGEAEYLASRLANATPSPNNVLGISEMLINAIEHGNLGISYADKTALVTNGTWRADVDRRLKLPENVSKYVRVTLNRNTTKLTLLIEDQGSGFDWQKYLNLDEIRVFDNHGRGIAISREYLELQFFPPGNKVLITIPLQ